VFGNRRHVRVLQERSEEGIRADHLGAPLPLRTGSSTAECLAAGYAGALALETGESQANDITARRT
jgi:hypothetical protein